LELGISLPPVRVGSGKTVYLDSRLIEKYRMLWHMSDGSSSPPSAGSIREFFFNIYYEDLEEILVVKLTKV